MPASGAMVFVVTIDDEEKEKPLVPLNSSSTSSVSAVPSTWMVPLTWSPSAAVSSNVDGVTESDVLATTSPLNDSVP